MSSNKLKKCKRCGKFFVNDGVPSKYCHLCILLDNEDFEKIRDFLYENGAATALEIEQNTGIPVKRIEGYLREGRLEIPANSPIFIKCELCGKEIRTGKYCDECTLKVSKGLNDMKFSLSKKAEEEIETGQMRYLNKKSNL